MNWNAVLQVAWKIVNSPAVIALIAGGLIWLLKHLVSLFADDSTDWNRAAAKDFRGYLRDIGEAGLLDYASAVVARLDLNEYFRLDGQPHRDGGGPRPGGRRQAAQFLRARPRGEPRGTQEPRPTCPP
jgi:hypothetical protein